MPLIRPADVNRVSKQAMVLDLGDLRRHGEELVARAKSNAETTIMEARAERERLIAGAREEGFAAGKADGHAAGLKEGRAEGIKQVREEERAKIEKTVLAWSKALETFESVRTDMLASAKEDLVRLAVEIGERVIRRAIELDPTIVREQIEAAIPLAMHATRLVVRVHPDDRETALALMPNLLKRFGGERQAEIEDDTTLSRGSCIVRTERGIIDAAIETQIQRVVQMILPGYEVKPAANTPAPPAAQPTAEGEQSPPADAAPGDSAP
ncbi:MAG TPA: FliH/SctL family protein [Phycisphaerales bacterium]|nr:FliH/SctL family protein [Phycisphaerales bacterium]